MKIIGYIKKIIKNKNHKKINSDKKIEINDLKEASDKLIKSISELNIKDNTINNYNEKKNLPNIGENVLNNLNSEIIKNIELNNKYKENIYNWKKIPFKNEVIPICEEIHISLKHGGINACQNALKILHIFGKDIVPLCFM